MISAPTLPDVRDLLTLHLAEHRRLPESARVRDLGAERTVWRDYDGRVIHELLQNALDRAERLIEVRWMPHANGGALVVANDGLPVSAYSRPREEGARRSDLHAILSLHSSAKRAGESIGNKGIGFRSVFAFTPEVEVWSRSLEGAWWGIRLRHPAALAPETPDAWDDHAVASFYAPELLEGAPPEAAEGLVTLIRLPQIPAENAARICGAIAELAARPLAFLERRARFQDGRLEVLLDDGTTRTAKPVAREARHTHAERVCIPVPPSVRERTGLDLELAEVRVMLPPPGEGGEPVYWSYLPAERSSGHGVHVHGDFYLQSSRRDVAFRSVSSQAPPPDPPGWNGWLLLAVAELIVDNLWRNPAVLEREDFWRLASPSAARCDHLRRAVAIRLLGTPGRFRQLVTEAFASPPQTGWTVRRYRDFFDALEAWANLAYNLYAHSGAESLRQITGRRETDWRNYLISEVRLSRARVLPIIEGTRDECAPNIGHAEPLPLTRSEARIYLRRSEGFRLPDAVVRQRTFVTTFVPLRSREPKEMGILEFERPEVLARLRPGEDPTEHVELLAAAVRLATEQPTAGGVGAVLARGPGFERPQPYWRFLTTDVMATAGRALACLFLPVEGGGWAPAYSVTLDPGWPGAPGLDVRRFAALAEAAWLSARPFDASAAAALFGVGPVPLGTEGDAPVLDIPAGVPVGATLLDRWDHALGPVALAFDTIQRTILETPWLDEQIPPEMLGGQLLAGDLGALPLRPLDLWWQDPRRGLRTRLLPMLERQHGPAPWMESLGVCGIGDGTADRTLRALNALKSRPDLLATRPAEVEALYTALATSLPEASAGPDVPVLVRRIAADGRVREPGWRKEGEEVWFDGGKATYALAAFGDYSLWVVRRDAARLAQALGLLQFEPGAPQPRSVGEEDVELREKFLACIWRALPDLFAAAAHAPVTPRFDGAAALRQAATLRARHAPSAWLEFTFAGRVGTLGEDDGDDVFLVPADDGGTPWLVFDGERAPLTPAAGALSELLCGNRAFVHVFTSGLAVWSDALPEVDPPGVRRFRREHGLSAAEVAGWQERLAASRMDPVQRAAWRKEVSTRLSKYGDVEPTRIDVDRPITPAVWSTIRNAAVTEDELAAKLADLDPPPRVLFAPTYRRAFLGMERVPWIAAAAEARGPNAWTEALYVELKEIGERDPSQEEEVAFRTLSCDVQALGRARYALLTGAHPPGLGALAFARGQIPLVQLPSPEAAPGTLVSWGADASAIGLAPAAEEEWLRKARRQASGGARAEDAVLVRAVDEAEAWRLDDPVGFSRALRTAWLGAWAEKRVRDAVEAANNGGRLNRVLHASGLVGNAGYDLLVPDRAGARLLKVEVKRVEKLDGAAFFLSENERRQALVLGEDWRLWLVSGDGRARDVTWIRDALEKAEPPVGVVLTLGLRPGEWLVRVG